MTLPPTVRIRLARPAELSDVLGVLNAAALETDTEAVRASIDRDEALVAVSGCAGSTDETEAGAATVVGALVLDGEEIVAVAVRRNRRGQGIGRALVERASDGRDRLVAEFDRGVGAFYDRLGFEIEPLDEADRFRAVRPPGRR